MRPVVETDTLEATRKHLWNALTLLLLVAVKNTGYWTRRAMEDAPWLVFLPGLTADHRLFDGQMAALGNRYHCLVWDAPAHGASRPFDLHFSMDDMAQYLHGILAAENIERPVLVGQSMGGYVAQVFIARWPEEVRGFIAIDSAPLSRAYFTRAELALLKHTQGLYLAFPWRLLLVAGSHGCAETAYGRRLMAMMMQGYSKQEYCALAGHGYRLIAEAVEARADYRLECPTLLLLGEHDKAASTARYNRMWAAREGQQLVLVPGAGHNANTDNVDFVNREIEGFVKRLG